MPEYYIEVKNNILYVLKTKKNIIIEASVSLHRAVTASVKGLGIILSINIVDNPLSGVYSPSRPDGAKELYIQSGVVH